MNENLIPCPFCKTPIPDDCIYCDTCGEKLRKCTSCGAFAKSKRCTKCGKPTEEIHPATDSLNGKSSAFSAQVISKPVSVPPGHLVCLSVALRLGLSHDAVIGRRGSYGNALNMFPSISGLHARLILKGDVWQIVDIGSSYGTFLNGKQLERDSPAAIKVGDIIKFADIEFKVTE